MNGPLLVDLLVRPQTRSRLCSVRLRATAAEYDQLGDGALAQFAVLI